MDNGTTWTNFKNPTGTLRITDSGTYNVTNYAYVQVAQVINVSTGSTTYPSYTYTNSKNTSVTVECKNITLSSNIDNGDAKLSIRVNGTQKTRVGRNTPVNQSYTVPANGTFQLYGDIDNPYSHSGVYQSIAGTLYIY